MPHRHPRHHPPAPPRYIPTSRFGHRVAQLHGRLLARLAAVEQLRDRRAPAPSELTAEVAPLLARTRLLLSRHRLQSEVPPLRAGAEPVPDELFVRLVRAERALETLFEELIKLSPPHRTGL